MKMRFIRRKLVVAHASSLFCARTAAPDQSGLGNVRYRRRWCAAALAGIKARHISRALADDPTLIERVE
jgi:hypothetical protein